MILFYRVNSNHKVVCKMLFKLRALFWKNLMFRKKHYIVTIMEILFPMTIFALLSYSRFKISDGLKTKIVSKQEFEASNLNQIYARIDLEDFNLWYAPSNNFTENIINNIVESIQLPGTSNNVELKENLEIFFSGYLPTKSNYSYFFCIIFKCLFNQNKSVELRAYANQKQLLNGNPGKISSICGIVFDTSNPKHLSYNIHMYTKDQSWDTNVLYITKYRKVNEREDTFKYISNGFVAIQMAINTAFMKLHGYTMEDYQFQLQQFSIPEHEVDEEMFVLFNVLLPLFTIFSFIIQCAIVNKQILEEKDSGIKEYMKIVGVGPWLQFLALIINVFISVALSISGIVFTMKVNIFGKDSALIENSNAIILSIFLICYLLVTLVIFCIIASVCNNVTSSMSYGIIFSILSHFIPNFIKEYMQIPNKIIDLMLMLFPNAILSQGYEEIFYFEAQKSGIQWNNLFDSSNINQSNISLGILLIILAVEFACFSLLYIYLDNINPGQYGIAKPFYYPLIEFLKCMKCGRKRKVANSRLSKERFIRNENIEIPDNSSIEFQNVNKIYGKKIVVEDLNFAVAKNEITVLLGRNGAGKTTIISMMTGMIEATSGNIYINGKNIKIHTNEARKSIGLCTQHNLLFNYLTVKEHLIFFSMLKRNKNKVVKEINDILKDIGLEEKENENVDNLSGGMKRRLCLGIALIGIPEILILDEPTSGVDIENRLYIIKFLERQKKNKTIIITTHSLDDTDALADRIAILNKSLVCYGTKKFINQLYNLGYKLELHFIPEYIDIWIDVDARLLLKKLKDDLKIQEIVLIAYSVRKSTATLRLPLELQPKLPEILQYLENNKAIKNMELSSTSLKDIFYNAINSLKPDATTKNKNINKLEEIGNLLQHIKIDKKQNNFFLVFFKLLEKRFLFLFSTNSFQYYCPQIFAMLFCFFIALALGKGVKYYYKDVVTLDLQLNVYHKPDIYYSISDDKELTKAYKNIVETQIGKSPIDSTPNLIEAVLNKAHKNIDSYNNNILAGTDFKGNNCNYNITSYFLKDAIHSVPISVNLAMNAIFKKCLDKNVEYGISASITPLILDKMDNIPNALSAQQMVMLWAIFIPTAIIIFTSVFMVFPFFEISTEFTEIQFMSGISRPVYWIANYIFDVTVAFISISLTSTIFFWSFNLEEYGIMLTIFMTFVCCSLPITYTFVYFINNLNLSIIRHIYISIIIGILPSALMILIEKHYINFEEVNLLFFIVQIIFNILPTFSLHHMSIKFVQTYVEIYNWNILTKNQKGYLCLKEETKNPCCNEDSSECAIYKNYYLNETNGLQIDMYASIFWFFVTVICTFLWMMFYNRRKTNFNCKNKIYDKSEPNYGYNVQNISYSVSKTEIVKDVNFDVQTHHCLGLMGPNGCGKTSLVRILVNQIYQNQGTVKLDNLSQDDPKYLSLIGYCPQIDSLNYEMSGENILKFLALVKGYNKSQANEITKSLIKLFDFEMDAQKMVKTYSGGTKRKLCTCLALLASPRLIILDEPTTGVDFITTNAFQQTLRKIITKCNSKVILCSHSMVEIETLCNRVAIMKAGEIKEFATLKELKNKFQNEECGALYDYKVLVPNHVTAQELASSLAANGMIIGKIYEYYIGKYCIPIACEGKLSEMYTKINNIDSSLIVTCTTFKDAYIYAVQDELRNYKMASTEVIVNVSNEDENE